MQEAYIRNMIITIISDVLSLGVNHESRLEDFTEWDSMAQFIILSKIESQFKIQFKLEDLQSVTSVHDWIHATEKTITKKA